MNQYCREKRSGIIFSPHFVKVLYIVVDYVYQLFSVLLEEEVMPPHWRPCSAIWLALVYEQHVPENGPSFSLDSKGRGHAEQSQQCE